MHFPAIDILVIREDFDLADERFIRRVFKETVMPNIAAKLLSSKAAVLLPQPVRAMFGQGFGTGAAGQDGYR